MKRLTNRFVRYGLGRWLMLAVIAAGVCAGLAVQFRITSPAAEASPIKLATRTIVVSPIIHQLESPRFSKQVKSSPEEIEPRVPRQPLYPTPTGVVFPPPLLAPKADGAARTADVPILMYHYISAPPSPADRIRVGLSVPPELFDEQLQLLVDNGFTTITLFDLYQHLAVGRALPDKPIVLTFDDGYVDNYQNAFPLLKKHGLTGTFFVLTTPPDVKDSAYLSWDMIDEMSRSGMDMQLHAKTHVDLRRRSYEDLIWQIIGGRQSIEGHTGKPVVFMAYPSGKYDDAVLKFLSNNNFWAAVTTDPGTTHALKTALTWTRVRIAGQLSLESFASVLHIK